MSRDGRASTRGSGRHGMTLIEIMVVLAILALVTAIGLPSLRALFDVEQRAAARELAQMYQFLEAEAMLRNVTFRIAYNLDRGTYRVEVGDPGATVFGSPEAREKAEKELRDKLKLFTKKELAEGKGPSDATQSFASLDIPAFQTQVELPGSCIFGWVWTPQYEKPATPSEEAPQDPEDESVAYSYIFANGSAEYTMVRIVDVDNPEDGYTVEVEPMSGRVSVDAELRDVGAALAWLPREAPTLQ